MPKLVDAFSNRNMDSILDSNDSSVSLESFGLFGSDHLSPTPSNSSLQYGAQNNNNPLFSSNDQRSHFSTISSKSSQRPLMSDVDVHEHIGMSQNATRSHAFGQQNQYMQNAYNGGALQQIPTNMALTHGNVAPRSTQSNNSFNITNGVHNNTSQFQQDRTRFNGAIGVGMTVNLQHQQRVTSNGGRLHPQEQALLLQQMIRLNKNPIGMGHDNRYQSYSQQSSHLSNGSVSRPNPMGFMQAREREEQAAVQTASIEAMYAANSNNNGFTSNNYNISNRATHAHLSTRPMRNHMENHGLPGTVNQNYQSMNSRTAHTVATNTNYGISSDLRSNSIKQSGRFSQQQQRFADEGNIIAGMSEREYLQLLSLAAAEQKGSRVNPPGSNFNGDFHGSYIQSNSFSNRGLPLSAEERDFVSSSSRNNAQHKEQYFSRNNLSWTASSHSGSDVIGSNSSASVPHVNVTNNSSFASESSLSVFNNVESLIGASHSNNSPFDNFNPSTINAGNSTQLSNLWFADN
jgi:hypothetical protein